MGLLLPNPGEHDYTASFNWWESQGRAREKEHHGIKEAKAAGILSMAALLQTPVQPFDTNCMFYLFIHHEC